MNQGPLAKWEYDNPSRQSGNVKYLDSGPIPVFQGAPGIIGFLVWHAACKPSKWLGWDLSPYKVIPVGAHTTPVNGDPISHQLELAFGSHLSGSQL